MTVDTWLCEQVSAYGREQHRYERYAKALEKILGVGRARWAPLAFVQSRAKAIPSFTFKAVKKAFKYVDPVHQITDLCGARVVTHTQEEVQRICEFIRKHFIIDEANSFDFLDVTRPNEFGYRSVHFVVQLDANALRKGIPVEISPTVLKAIGERKAEIQVRTLLQHVWSDVMHDRIYKAGFEVPPHWHREAARIAAVLEEGDRDISRFVSGLSAYETDFGAYLSHEEIEKEIVAQLAAYRALADRASGRVKDGGLQKIAHRLGALSMALGDWDQALEHFGLIARPTHQPLLRDRGIATCQKHRSRPRSTEYERGRADLDRAIEMDARDARALLGYGRSFGARDRSEALSWFQKAFEADPEDPCVFSAYLTRKVVAEKSLAIVDVLRPAIEKTIGTCHRLAESGIDVTDAYFCIGRLELLRGRPYDSLRAFCHAILWARGGHEIQDALHAIEHLKPLEKSLPAIGWARNLLLLAGAGVPRLRLPGTRRRIKALRTHDFGDDWRPILVLAGSCAAAERARMKKYETLLHRAFEDFEGILIGGGTKAGISGIAAQIGWLNRKRITLIGYVPADLEHRSLISRSYRPLIETTGTAFSPLEPLQYWVDLIAAGVEPDRVGVLGVGGGDISGFEYDLALALGARVAVLQGSGRKVAELEKPTATTRPRRVGLLPADLMIVKSFVEHRQPTLDASDRNVVARAVHAKYQQTQLAEGIKKDKAMADWPKLSAKLQESNRRQADDIERKLLAIGHASRASSTGAGRVESFSIKHIEIMAEMEHARWSVERTLEGWVLGKTKDEAKKISPYLVPWSELPENVKQWDRNAVINIPNLLALVKREVHKP